MSSKLAKNEIFSELIIKDKNAFIFNIQKKKKFNIIKEDNAVNIQTGYLISFGGSSNLGNDLYIHDSKTGGMNRNDYYGDKEYETSNGQSRFSISEFKVYLLSL